MKAYAVSIKPPKRSARHVMAKGLDLLEARDYVYGSRVANLPDSVQVYISEFSESRGLGYNLEQYRMKSGIPQLVWSEPVPHHERVDAIRGGDPEEIAEAFPSIKHVISFVERNPGVKAWFEDQR